MTNTPHIHNLSIFDVEKVVVRKQKHGVGITIEVIGAGGQLANSTEINVWRGSGHAAPEVINELQPVEWHHEDSQGLAGPDPSHEEDYNSEPNP